MPILSAEERVGRTLDGKYEIGAPIATGGMGVVYRGKHAWTGRDVAIKVLQPGLSLDAEISRRFLTEARASASLRHPNVVDVLDMGRDEDGTLYMVLELLEGRDLDEVLEERRVLAPSEAIAAIAPTLEALAFAHEKGFVHRDIKPSNLYLAIDARGVVVPKILDFGIAKALDGGANKATRTGVIIGTPHYMAPEQASGVGVIGPATDTWSMGVVLYEALTGVLPFDGASPTMILMNVLGKRAAPVCSAGEGIPATLGALVDQMLEPDADARPADLRALAKQLRALLPAGSDEAATLATLARPQDGSASVASAPTAILSARSTEPSLARPEHTEPIAARAPVRAGAAAAEPTATPARPWRAVALGAAVVVGLAGVWWWSSRSTEAGAGDPPVAAAPRAEAADPAAEPSGGEPPPTATPAPATPATQRAPQPQAIVPERGTPARPELRATPRLDVTPEAAPTTQSPPTTPTTPSPAPVEAPPPETAREPPAPPPEPRVERAEPRETSMAPRPITEIQEEF